jgi:hypothetical protein
MNHLDKFSISDLEKIILAAQKIIETKKEEEHPQPVVKDMKQKILCDICGGRYTIANKSKHVKTKKHINEVEWMKSLKKVARSKTLVGRAT